MIVDLRGVGSVTGPDELSVLAELVMVEVQLVIAAVRDYRFREFDLANFLPLFGSRGVLFRSHGDVKADLTLRILCHQQFIAEISHHLPIDAGLVSAPGDLQPRRSDGLVGGQQAGLSERVNLTQIGMGVGQGESRRDRCGNRSKGDQPWNLGIRVISRR